jgi:polysaccharide biosynthesis/export protein
MSVVSDSRNVVAAQPKDPRSDYDVIEVTPDILDAISQYEPGGFVGTFGPGGAVSSSHIGVGDLVQITIFEASAGGLFTSGDPLTAGNKNVTLPVQEVDSTGRVSVPFAGRIRASGRTPAEVQIAIQNALATKAIEPQAIVSITQHGSRFVTVSGEVGQGGRFPLITHGDTVLDAVAQAGGPKSPAHQTYVRLTRGSRSSVMKLDQLVARPSENIHLTSGDQVFLYRNPQSLTVLGALTNNANVEFDSEKMTLAEGLGKANGLMNFQSDPSAVFVFRFENNRVLRAIDRNNPDYAKPDADSPVVYRVNLRSARGVFLAQAFMMRDKDVLYVSNAPSTDLAKFMGLLQQGASLASSAAATNRFLNPVRR